MKNRAIKLNRIKKREKKGKERREKKYLTWRQLIAYSQAEVK